MNADFKHASDATSPAKNQLVFVSDFMGTIESRYGVNIPLLKLLTDAKASGHRVIVASTSALSSVESFLKAVITYGKNKGIPLDHIQDIINDGDVLAKHELCELTDEHGQPLKADFAFDDNPVFYIKADHEIRVTPPFYQDQPFKTSPLSLDQIRLSFIADYLKTLPPDRTP